VREVGIAEIGTDKHRTLKVTYSRSYFALLLAGEPWRWLVRRDLWKSLWSCMNLTANLTCKNPLHHRTAARRVSRLCREGV